jgi:hypothetical protein
MNGFHLLAGIVLALIGGLYLIGFMGDIGAAIHRATDPYNVVVMKEHAE